MKKLVLVAVLACVAFAGYCVNASTNSAKQANAAADTYTLSVSQISIPRYGDQATITIYKNGQIADVKWSLDNPQVYNFDVQPEGYGSSIDIINTDSNNQGCYGMLNIYIDAYPYPVLGPVYINNFPH